MKTAYILAMAGLLVMAAPVGQAHTTEEMVDIALDHLAGRITSPCVETDQNIRPLDLGDDPDYDYWVDSETGDVTVVVYLPGLQVVAVVNHACLHQQ